MKQDESQGCFKPSYVPGPGLWPLSGEGGCSEEGTKRDIMSNKAHPRNHQHAELCFVKNRS